MIRNVNDSEERRRYLPLSLGRIVITTPAMAVFEEHEMDVDELITGLLILHTCGQWGEVGPEDWAANEHAIRHGERVMSVYKLPKTGETVWVITEWDRSVTTLLLPEDY